MNSLEIIAAVATSLGVLTFAVIFTILYHVYTRTSIKEVRAGKRDIELMDAYIHEMKLSVRIRRKVWAIVKGVCFYGILAVLIPVFVLSMYNKMQGNVTMLGDRAVMVVASGSMSVKHPANDYLVSNALDNQFDTYDMIVLERVEEGDLQLYDVIAFVDNTGKNVIHRIIGVNADGTYVTRGDANNTNDSFHPTHQNIVGRYTGDHVPAVGSLVMFLQSAGGIVTLLALVYCIIMLDRFNSKLRDEEADRLEQLCTAIDFDPDYSAGKPRAEFVETLYYKGYVYLFNEHGFVGKDEIADEKYLEKSDTTAIRVINKNGVRSESEITIESETIESERRGDETP